MNSRISCYLTALICLVIPATGCKTIDDATPGSFASLTDTISRDTVEKQPVSDAGESITLASMRTPNQPAIRTLKESEDLNELVGNSSGVVLLDFYADWCDPCKKQSRELHKLEEFASNVNAQIIKVNVDEHADLAKDYGVTSLPTLVVMKDGAVLKRKLGLTGQEQLKDMLR